MHRYRCTSKGGAAEVCTGVIYIQQGSVVCTYGWCTVLCSYFSGGNGKVFATFK